MLVLNLPWPPSVNNYWQTKSINERFISKRGMAFRNEVVAATRGLKGPLTGRLYVTMDVYPPDKRKRDIDNLTKATLDSLEKAKVYVNDSQIDKLLIERKQIVKGGVIVVVIREIECSSEI